MSKDLQFPIKDNFDRNAFSVNFPIYATTAYRSPEGDHFRYSRELNPTVEELSRQISQLEGSQSSTCFSSGMGAISTAFLSLLKPGDHLVMPMDVFGRTYLFARDFLSKFGVRVTITDPGTERVMEAIKNGTRMIFVESLSNPVLRVYDIRTLAESAKDNGSVLVVDDTIITPIGQRSIDNGADIVVNSLSKFIGGHNAAIGGSASGPSKIIEEVDSNRRSLGASMDPFPAFLFLQGMKTLKLRIDHSSSSARAIAEHLAATEHVDRVFYPGLTDSEYHDVAKRTMNNYGSVVSFILDADIDPLRFMSSLETIIPANTMGGVETLISNPYTMSHRNLGEQDKARIGVVPRLMRLSVGIEDTSTIIEDLEKSIKKAKKH